MGRNKRKRIGIGRTHEEKSQNEVESEDLGSVISWHNTAINAMDGDAISVHYLMNLENTLKTFL
jgi:hypothetical protein